MKDEQVDLLRWRLDAAEEELAKVERRVRKRIADDIINLTLDMRCERVIDAILRTVRGTP